MAFARLRPQALQRFRLGAHSVRVEAPVQGVMDQRITPVFLDDAADALRRLVETPYTGIIHLAAASWTTPYEFAASIARHSSTRRSTPA